MRTGNHDTAGSIQYIHREIQHGRRSEPDTDGFKAAVFQAVDNCLLHIG